MVVVMLHDSKSGSDGCLKKHLRAKCTMMTIREKLLISD